MNLEKYVLNKKQEVEIAKKELKNKESEFLNFSKSLKFFSKKGLDVSISEKDGHDFYLLNDESFYSMIKDYRIQESRYSRGGDFDYNRSSGRSCFFQWGLNGGKEYPYVMNEDDFEFMKIYSISKDIELKDSDHCHTSELFTEEVLHGRDISEIVHYFMKKGVSFDILSRLEKDIVGLRKNNPIKLDKRWL